MASVLTVTVMLLVSYPWYVPTAAHIPEDVQRCYAQDRRLLQEEGLPLTVAVLTELIRKVETHPGAALDLGSMAGTLLHRLRVDGIYTDVTTAENDHVIPVTQSKEADTWSVVARLVAGDGERFPEGSLGAADMCALHAMLSPTVDTWVRPYEYDECPKGWSADSTGTSRCPLEGGAVLTPWGTVSPGHVVAAIAAATQAQTVRVVDAVRDDVMGHDAHAARARSRLRDLPDQAAVSNLWAATLAGKLAEVVLYQAAGQEDLRMAVSGVWDHEVLPRRRFLQGGPWEMTEATLLGAIDGLILGSQIPEWYVRMRTLRMSHLLDMYYSYRGVSLDSTYRACTRWSKLRQLMDGERVLRETTNMAHILYYSSRYPMVMDNIPELSRRVVDEFLLRLEDLVRHDECGPPSSSAPRATVHVAVDGTWTDNEVVRLLSTLASSEHTYVSAYGSHMGVVDGRGGWLINTTASFSELFRALNDVTDWPTYLQLPGVFNTILNTLNENLLKELIAGVIGTRSHVVLVLAVSSTISNDDLQRSKQIVDMFSTQQPDVHFLYVTSPHNSERFRPLLRISTHLDSVVVVTNDRGSEGIEALVTEQLRRVPWRVFPSTCGPSELSAYMEDYVVPNETSTYRIAPLYLQGCDRVILKVRGSGYGSLSVCWSRNSPDDRTSCAEVEGHNEVKLHVQASCTDVCSPLYVRVAVRQSDSKCTEDDCRYPDQVRFTLLHQGLRCYEVADGNMRLRTSAAPAPAPMPLCLLLLLILCAH